MNQKLYEIERFILNSEEDCSICNDCDYNGKDYDEDDLKEEYEEGYEEGMNETLECIQEYVEKRLKLR